MRYYKETEHKSDVIKEMICSIILKQPLFVGFEVIADEGYNILRVNDSDILIEQNTFHDLQTAAYKLVSQRAKEIVDAEKGNYRLDVKHEFASAWVRPSLFFD